MHMSAREECSMTGRSSHVTPPAILSVDLGMPLFDQKLTRGDFAIVKLFSSDLVAEEDIAGHHVPQRLNHCELIGPDALQAHVNALVFIGAEALNARN